MKESPASLGSRGAGCVLGLLLGCHVDHQVHHTVAVPILIVIPADRNRKAVRTEPFLLSPPPRFLLLRPVPRN